MDTNEAISVIQSIIDKATAENTTFKASIEQNNKVIASATVAVEQLKGILNTPSADLAEAQAQIASLQEAPMVTRTITSDPVTLM